MLEKSMYDSWVSRTRPFIKGKKHGRMMLDSIDNGLLVYPTVEENRQTRPKKYSELTEAQQLQDDCDVQATNIILHGLLSDVYALVNHQEAAKDIWDIVKMLMKGTELSYQELRMNRERYPDSLAFVASSPTLYNPSQSPQHSGYSMYPLPQQFILVYAAPIHYQHHHTPVNPQQHPVSPTPFLSPSMIQQSQAEFPQLHSSLVVPMFQRMAYGKTLYLTKKTKECCVFKEKLMLAEAQEAGQILDEEQLAFLADPGISEAPVAQQTIPHNSTFQSDDLDAYNSDCVDLSSTKVVLMANLSSCDPEVLSEVPYSDSHPNDMINQDVQEMQYSEQTHLTIFKITRYIVIGISFRTLNIFEQMTDYVAHPDKE
ncbi:hypothetical protein Tco_1459930, partial [Tanacetum coccineum]